MNIYLNKQKRKPSATRKLPWFPRIGLYIDIGGAEYSLKIVPFSETILNLIERGLSIDDLDFVSQEQFKEVHFPRKLKNRVVEAKARPVESR